MDEPYIPERCRRVYGLLCECRGSWLRIKDILDRTGHPCDERKLRELRSINPGLVEVRWVTQDGRGWDEFRLAEDRRVGLITEVPVMGEDVADPPPFPQGVLFPSTGRGD